VLLGKKSILAGKKLNDIATISDKAFVLLILENIWHDMMEVSINEYYRPKKRKKMTDERSSEESNNGDLPTEPVADGGK